MVVSFHIWPGSSEPLKPPRQEVKAGLLFSCGEVSRRRPKACLGPQVQHVQRQPENHRNEKRGRGPYVSHFGGLLVNKPAKMRNAGCYVPHLGGSRRVSYSGGFPRSAEGLKPRAKDSGKA